MSTHMLMDNNCQLLTRHHDERLTLDTVFVFYIDLVDHAP